MPTLPVYALHLGYSRKRLAQAMLWTLFQLPDVAATDHLCMRIDQNNGASVQCLEKVGQKLGRTLHKVGAVDDRGNVDFRAIKPSDDLMECCLSRGPATIPPTPRKAHHNTCKRPGSQTTKGSRKKKK